MAVNIKGKKALVASDSNGIGKQIAKWLLQVGVHVAIASNFTNPSFSQDLPYCRVSADQIILKAKLLETGLKGDRQALESYKQLVQTHATELATCRKQSWLRTQATWLRVYPCDLKRGELAQILDNIANFGYNRIYLNVLYDGRILLPVNDNPTVWRSVVDLKDADLLAEVITQARQRGISVHAWLFSMNFGSGYAQRPDRQQAIAKNGYGETNLKDPWVLPEVRQAAHIFVDPYNAQARSDLQTAVQAIAKRQPDGMAFDYIRYSHRTTGIVSDVRDLMVYGISSGLTLLKRAVTQQGQDLIFDYMQNGGVKEQAIDPRLSPWKFPRQLPATNTLNDQLWELVLAHARLGVVEFLASAALAAKQQNIPTSAVFFPKANFRLGKAVDARLQPWPDFTMVSEWSPMLYSVCNSTSCIIDELTLVMEKAGKKPVCPVLAGYWGQKVGDRPALESQLDALHAAYPQLNCASQFAYSWLDFAEDTKRRTCKLQ